MRLESLLQAAGRTPVVHLRRVEARLPAPVFVDRSMADPGGIVKDRVGVAIEAAAGDTGSGAGATTRLEGPQ